jgi:putative chitinase
MTEDQLIRVMPLAKPRVAAFFTPLVGAMEEFGINTPARQAAFIAQVGHETGHLSRLSENLNYSADRLLVIFPKYFDKVTAQEYARSPRRIASRVYANRGGNGDEASGDGWTFRGAGGIQITFKDGHSACARRFGMDLLQVGDWLRTPEGAMRSAAWWWAVHELNEMADKGDFLGISGVINCGKATVPATRINGYADRVALYTEAKRVLT